jgi:hypothetical protein
VPTAQRQPTPKLPPVSYPAGRELRWGANRKLPAILAFLAFIEAEREGLTAPDWHAKFGHVHARITSQVLPAFSETVIAEARATLSIVPPPVYLPPEARA